MSYDLVAFKDLIGQFPTWDALKNHLQQLRLRIIDCGNDYYIIRYEKGDSHFSNPVVPLFRSVVWDARTHLPVCVSPPKATEGLPETFEGVQFEEFLEGDMINLFLDRDNEVRCVTRSKLDATGTFYSNRSFQELLGDAELDLRAVLVLTGSTFASLLLQHPEHRIVSRITEPTSHIIHTGTVAADGLVQITDRVPVITKPTDVPFDQWFRQLSESKGWQWQGLVMKEGTKRYRLRSSAYTMVRTMRGDSPRTDLRFLKLREKQMLETYAYYYPEDQAAMRALEQKIRGITHQLYSLYVDCHIKHAIAFADLVPQFKTHIWSLHNQYLTVLKARNHFIRKREVIEYVNALPAPRILHLLKLADA